MILKTIKSISKGQELEMLPLWKEDEYEFTQNLFRKGSTSKEENDSVLQNYSKNWEKERLATMDSLLMVSYYGGIRIFFYPDKSNIK